MNVFNVYLYVSGPNFTTIKHIHQVTSCDFLEPVTLDYFDSNNRQAAHHSSVR